VAEPYTGSCFCCPDTSCEQAGWDGAVPREWDEDCLAFDDREYDGPLGDDEEAVE
jgi:hypothetical protein